MKSWLVLLPLLFQYCLCAYRHSGDMLKMLKSEYPERKIEEIQRGDFKKWFVIGSRGPSRDPFKYAYLQDGEKFFERAKNVDGYEDIDMPDPLVFFPGKGIYKRYDGVLYELADTLELKIWTLKGQRCAGDIPGWRDLTNRPQSYIVNGYLSYNKDDVVDLLPLAEECLAATYSKHIDLKGFKLNQGDASRFTDAMSVLHKNHCWTQKERKCVDDQGAIMTASVPRKNAILHADDLTVYAQCCDKDNYRSRHIQCSPRLRRCSYFVYDHLSGIDFYIDDKLSKEMFGLDRVTFLVPAIEAEDHFVKNRRKDFTTTTVAPTTTTTTTTTLRPIAIPTAPPRPTPKDNPIEEEYGHEDDYEDEIVRKTDSSSRISQAFVTAIIFVGLIIY